MSFIYFFADASRNTSESRSGGSQVNDEKFTRNDIFYNPAPPSSINTAPVIPTSSQYGLAIVSETVNQTGETTPTVAVSAESPMTGEKNESDREIVHNR